MYGLMMALFKFYMTDIPALGLLVMCLSFSCVISHVFLVCCAFVARGVMASKLMVIAVIVSARALSPAASTPPAMTTTSVGVLGSVPLHNQPMNVNVNDLHHIVWALDRDPVSVDFVSEFVLLEFFQVT